MSALDLIPFDTMSGTATTLGDYAGHTLLIVNVASRCGLTPQYAALEELYRTYRERDFTVLGFPSNQFRQELSSNTAVVEYCQVNWGVTFPIMDRVRVNGRHTHPLYVELKKTPDASGNAGRVTWNFEKFLVSPDRRVRRFRPRTTPDDPAVVAAIEDALATPRA